MRRAAPCSLQTSKRRGSTVPLTVASLLLSMLGAALVFDRLWLETARVELTTASEAAALAAARALACDDRLKPNVDEELLANRALAAAQSIAEKNTVAGAPVLLDLAAGDVQPGRMSTTEQAGESLFLATDVNATHVQVTAHRSRTRNNPVALFVGGLTRQPYGDVAAAAVAGLDNRVVGFRPFDGAPVPAVPLAIWYDDPTGRCRETWKRTIDQKQGKDEFGFDPHTHQVTSGPDGLPEITLRSQPSRSSSDQVNLQLLDIGTALNADLLAQQFSHGIFASNLEEWDGMLPLPNASGLTLPSTPVLLGSDRDALQTLVGVARICWLYSQAVPKGPSKSVATCTGCVAVRVLAVRDRANGGAEIVVQPAVVTTRTAVTNLSPATPANPYIYRLTLTR